MPSEDGTIKLGPRAIMAVHFPTICGRDGNLHFRFGRLTGLASEETRIRTDFATMIPASGNSEVRSKPSDLNANVSSQVLAVASTDRQAPFATCGCHLGEHDGDANLRPSSLMPSGSQTSASGFRNSSSLMNDSYWRA